MPSVLCDHVVQRLTKRFGRPQRIGNLYRWAIASNPAHVVIGIDSCVALPITIWLFDTKQSHMDGLFEYTVTAKEDAERIVADISAKVQSPAAQTDTSP